MRRPAFRFTEVAAATGCRPSGGRTPIADSDSHSIVCGAAVHLSLDECTDGFCVRTLSFLIIIMSAIQIGSGWGLILLVGGGSRLLRQPHPFRSLDVRN